MYTIDFFGGKSRMHTRRSISYQLSNMEFGEVLLPVVQGHYSRSMAQLIQQSTRKFWQSAHLWKWREAERWAGQGLQTHIHTGMVKWKDLPCSAMAISVSRLKIPWKTCGLNWRGGSIKRKPKDINDSERFCMEEGWKIPLTSSQTCHHFQGCLHKGLNQ